MSGDPLQQFARQVETLVELGYPDLFGRNAAAFREALAPLSRCLPGGPAQADLENGSAAFVIVIHSALVSARATLQRIRCRGGASIEALHPAALESFKPTAAVARMSGDAYLLLDIDRGSATRNITPDVALPSIQAQGRLPLTIEEGIALLTHLPEFLQPNRLLKCPIGDRVCEERGRMVGGPRRSGRVDRQPSGPTTQQAPFLANPSGRGLCGRWPSLESMRGVTTPRGGLRLGPHPAKSRRDPERVFQQPANNCFSLLGSRRGDKRVPALWLSEGRPKLGWCWAGNPHTWLGSASCGKRSDAVRLGVCESTTA